MYIAACVAARTMNSCSHGMYQSRPTNRDNDLLYILEINTGLQVTWCFVLIKRKWLRLTFCCAVDRLEQNDTKLRVFKGDDIPDLGD
jgi:hypothetical protein